MDERSEITETKKRLRLSSWEELARRLCIEKLIETREWVISDEPRRLAGGLYTLQIYKKEDRGRSKDYPCPVLVYMKSLRDIDSKPVLPEFLKEFATKHDFVADLRYKTHYTGPN